jgi:hypothetical protein
LVVAPSRKRQPESAFVTFATHPTVYPTIQVALLQKLHKISTIYEDTRNSGSAPQPADSTEISPTQSAISVREYTLNLINSASASKSGLNGKFQYSTALALQFAARENRSPSEIAEILLKLWQSDRPTLGSDPTANPYIDSILAAAAIVLKPSGWMEITVSDAGLCQWLHSLTKFFETTSTQGFHLDAPAVSVNSPTPFDAIRNFVSPEVELRTYTDDSSWLRYSPSFQQNLRTYTDDVTHFIKTSSLPAASSFGSPLKERLAQQFLGQKFLAQQFSMQHAHARCCGLLRMGEREAFIQCEEIDPMVWRITDPDPLPWQAVLPFLPPTAVERELIWQLELVGNGLNKEQPEQWMKLAIALSQAIQRFDAACPMVTREVKLAQVRLGLVQLAQRMLRSLLERLQIAAPVEL